MSNVQDDSANLNELLDKLHEFERTHPAMTPEIREEFEKMLRLAQKRTPWRSPGSVTGSKHKKPGS